MKRAAALCIALLLPTLGGCSLGGSVETLMKPPKLSIEQEQIYTALKSVAGSNIQLKYPKSGDYLSAFIVSDIDCDGADEAIVFYERGAVNADENPLRVNVLDQIDGVWRSVHDRGAAGADIEEVIISPLGENERINIIIGYSTVTGSERIAEVYDYRGGTLERTLSKSYSMMEVSDLNKDETNELFIVSGQTASQSARAAVYQLDVSGTYYESVASLPNDFTDCTQLLCGNTEDGTPAIFIDGVVGPSAIRTEILRLEESRLIRVNQDSAASDTTRPTGYAAQDIDSDGTVELPVCTVFPGYEDMSETERITMTSWYTYAGDMLIRKHTGYYSINDSYAFLLPDRWKNKVTLKRDSVAQELVFYSYGGSLQSSTDELLRLCVTADSVTVSDCLDNGYLLLGAKGGTHYLAKSAESDNPLVLTTGEIITAFLY